MRGVCSRKHGNKALDVKWAPNTIEQMAVADEDSISALKKRFECEVLVASV